MPFRIFRSVEEAAGAFGPCAVTIGNFDGAHVGHQRIFSRVVELARANSWVPSVLTFDPHPTSVVAPDRAPRLLSTLAQRIEWMRQSGIEHVLVLPFTKEFAKLTPEDFVRSILVDAIEARAVLVGENFRFGARQAGDTALLRRIGEESGFFVETIPAVQVRSWAVSSSDVRLLIGAGRVAQAARLLGRHHAIEGDVISGRGVGSRQTVPTLNLATEAEIIPGRGVYVTRTTDMEGGRIWPSVTNIGYRPTFGSSSELSIETFLLRPLEGETPRRIRLEFLRRIREEKKFESTEELKAQILRDAAAAQSWHRRSEKWVRARTASVASKE